MKRNKREKDSDESEDGDYQNNEQSDSYDDVDVIIDPKTKKRKQLFPERKPRQETRKAVLLLDQMLLQNQGPIGNQMGQKGSQQASLGFMQPTELDPESSKTTRNSHIFGFLQTVDERYVPREFDLVQRGP